MTGSPLLDFILRPHVRLLQVCLGSRSSSSWHEVVIVMDHGLSRQRIAPWHAEDLGHEPRTAPCCQRSVERLGDDVPPTPPCGDG